jgi:Rieske Fe-S protein
MADDSHPTDSASASRRHWLVRALSAMVAVTGAVILYPVVRFLRPRLATTSGAMEKEAPFSLKELKVDAEGNWPSPFNFGGKPCLVIRTPDGTLRAFNAICTHLDCTVAYRPEESDIFCPCHNGVYDLHGRVVSGPPPRPLEEYQVEARGDRGQEKIVVSRTS